MKNEFTGDGFDVKLAEKYGFDRKTEALFLKKFNNNIFPEDTSVLAWEYIPIKSQNTISF